MLFRSPWDCELRASSFEPLGTASFELRASSFEPLGTASFELRASSFEPLGTASFELRAPSFEPLGTASFELRASSFEPIRTACFELYTQSVKLEEDNEFTTRSPPTGQHPQASKAEGQLAAGQFKPSHHPAVTVLKDSNRARQFTNRSQLAQHLLRSPPL